MSNRNAYLPKTNRLGNPYNPESAAKNVAVIAWCHREMLKNKPGYAGRFYRTLRAELAKLEKLAP
jgi:hypothetical protein